MKTHLTALATTDAALVRCELDRVRRRVSVEEPGGVAGVGAYSDSVVVQTRFGVGTPRGGLWEAPDSSVVVIASDELPSGASFEDNAQPFRFRNWLVASATEIQKPERFRDQLLSQLPDYLHRMVRGTTVNEAVFATVLRELRDLNQSEDTDISARVVADVLLRVGRSLSHAAADLGAGSLGWATIATNGSVLAGARGGMPLHVALLEGEQACERCGISATDSEERPRVRDHRRRRSVVFATHASEGTEWNLVPDGGAFAVDRRLEAVRLLGPASRE